MHASAVNITQSECYMCGLLGSQKPISKRPWIVVGCWPNFGIWDRRRLHKKHYAEHNWLGIILYFYSLSKIRNKHIWLGLYWQRFKGGEKMEDMRR